MGRLLENVWKLRTASWYRRRRPTTKGKIRNPAAYAMAIQRLSPADIRARQLEQRSTTMRKYPTKHEQAAYWALKLLNLPFRRQVVIGRYIADFILTTRNVVLEIDGESHSRTLRYDKARDTFLRDMGWTVLRVKNEDVSFEYLRTLLAPFPTVSLANVKRRIDYARRIERYRIEDQARSIGRHKPSVETRPVEEPAPAVTTPDTRLPAV